MPFWLVSGITQTGMDGSQGAGRDETDRQKVTESIDGWTFMTGRGVLANHF